MLARIKKVLHKEEKGFTLIELMIVILIIGILVAIAVPVFNAAKRNAQRRTCQANLRTLNGAVQQYHADNDGDPSVVTITTANWNSQLVNGGAPNGSSYLKKAPTCPYDASNAYQFFQEQALCANNIADASLGHTY